MHLLIAHAAPQGPRCRAALQKHGGLQLPHLAQLLRRMTPVQQRTGSADSLIPLFEHMHAGAVGIDGDDGLVPWAALGAQQMLPITTSATPDTTRGWAWITPCHWRVNADHVEMLDPADLALTAQESATLMETMRVYFAEDGITLHAAPASAGTSTWLAHGATLKGLPTASIERARGASVDRWMPRQPQAKPLRRLQNEMQMLLYTHPLNDARLAARKTTINSFWVSGTGDLPAHCKSPVAPSPFSPGGACTVNDTLRQSNLHDDDTTWLDVWRTLDRTVLADLLIHHNKYPHAAQLSLCGEAHAHTLAQQTMPWWQRLQRRFAAPSPAALIATL